jgi:hypothetical protein
MFDQTLDQSIAAAHLVRDDSPCRKQWQKLSCALFGHRVNNYAFGVNCGPAKHCRCGVKFLEHHEETRVSHTVSCFLLGHNYIRIAERAGHHEYVCGQCGHPLLFRIDKDPYANRDTFRKKVRYLCNLFGHRVHHVTARIGFHEYACDCGHSFLKKDPARNEIKHPPICLFAGHFLRFTERRGGWDEYLCRNCGHTFYFMVTQ